MTDEDPSRPSEVADGCEWLAKTPLVDLLRSPTEPTSRSSTHGRDGSTDHLREVVEHSLSSERAPSDALLDAMCDAADTPSAQRADAIRTLASAHFRQLIDQAHRPAMVSQLMLVARADDPLVREPARKLYDEFTSTYAKAYTSLLNSWGLELSGPFTTTRELAIALTSLIDGYAVRALADPTVEYADAFASAVVALVGASTRSIGAQTNDLGDWRARAADTKRNRSKAAVLAAATAAMTEVPLSDLTLGAIAKNAHVAKGTLRAHFQSIEHLLAAVVARDIEGLLADHQSDGADPVHDVVVALRRFGERVLEHPQIYRSLLAVRARSSSDERVALELAKEHGPDELVVAAVERAFAGSAFKPEIEGRFSTVELASQLIDETIRTLTAGQALEVNAIDLIVFTYLSSPVTSKMEHSDALVYERLTVNATRGDFRDELEKLAGFARDEEAFLDVLIDVSERVAESKMHLHEVDAVIVGLGNVMDNAVAARIRDSNSSLASRLHALEIAQLLRARVGASPVTEVALEEAAADAREKGSVRRRAEEILRIRAHQSRRRA